MYVVLESNSINSLDIQGLTSKDKDYIEEIISTSYVVCIIYSFVYLY